MIYKYPRKKKAILYKIMTSNAQCIISDFTRRYQKYYRKNLEGVWMCKLLFQDDYTICLHLIDKDYNVLRGCHAKPEAPVICLSFQQNGADVILTYQCHYQKRVRILYFLLLIGIVLSSAMLLGYGFNTLVFWRGIICFLLAIADWVLAIAWLVQDYKHNCLTIRVFEELLQKNFDVDFQYN